MIYIYIYIWANYNISLTWIKAILGWFPLLTMIIVRSQWGRYNLPRDIYIYRVYAHDNSAIWCRFLPTDPPPAKAQESHGKLLGRIHVDGCEIRTSWYKVVPSSDVCCFITSSLRTSWLILAIVSIENYRYIHHKPEFDIVINAATLRFRLPGAPPVGGKHPMTFGWRSLCAVFFWR